MLLYRKWAKPTCLRISGLTLKPKTVTPVTVAQGTNRLCTSEEVERQERFS
jgi:hypothetical protein